MAFGFLPNYCFVEMQLMINNIVLNLLENNSYFTAYHLRYTY